MISTGYWQRQRRQMLRSPQLRTFVVKFGGEFCVPFFESKLNGEEVTEETGLAKVAALGLLM